MTEVNLTRFDLVPERYRKVITLTDEIDVIREWCSEKGTALLVTGSYGEGKTQVAAAAVYAFAIKWNAEHEGYTFGRGTSRDLMWTTARDLFIEIRRGFGESLDRDRDPLIRAKETRLLVLDDLAAERPTDWVGETREAIVDARYASMLPLIVTTNLPLHEMDDKLGGRIGSRLAEMTHGGKFIIALGGGDRRRS